MRSPAGSEPKALTSWRVLVAVMFVVVATVAAGVWAVQQQIRTRTLDTTVKGVMILSSVVIDRSLTLADITQGIHPANRAELDADMILLKGRGAIVSLAIWSLADGKLVYTDVDYRSDTVLSPELLARAREGQPFVAPTHAHSDPKTLEIYYPYDANGDGKPDAVAAVILPSQEVDASIAQATTILYAAGVLILLLALTGIALVRRRQIGQDHAAVHDSLTGLGNRVLLRRAAEPALAAATTSSPAALLLIDLDNFKAVNDTLGHQAGDELLVSMAKLTRSICEPSGVVTRLGGDEFAVLLPRLDGPLAAWLVAERIRDAIARPVTVVGAVIEIDASIGMAWAPADGARLGVLLRCADVAMYQAKHSGGGVVAYDAEVGMPPGVPRRSGERPDEPGET